MEEREDEIKYLLGGPEDHARLVAALPGRSETEVQDNLYLDTADLRLASALAMLRVRRSPGRPARLTLKSGTEVEAGYFRSTEIESELEPEALAGIVADPRHVYRLDLAPAIRLRSLFGVLPLELIGTLRNERTRFSAGGFVVEVDRMRFPGGGEEFEVEVETRDPAAARDWLLSTFAGAQVRAEPGRRTKFERLLARIDPDRARRARARGVKPPPIEIDGEARR